jgi:hypothetical protein
MKTVDELLTEAFELVHRAKFLMMHAERVADERIVSICCDDMMLDLHWIKNEIGGDNE